MSQSIDGPPATAGRLDPGAQAFVDSLKGAAPIHLLGPDAARAALRGAQEAAKVEVRDVAVEDRVLAVGPTGRARVRLLRPASATGALPAVIYIHGGGWVMGDMETHDRLVRELAFGSNAVVIFVDYERSPESRYPVAIEQSYAVLEYLSDHDAEFGADASLIAVAGDSVGGNMATVLSLMTKARKGPKLSAQLLFYPVADASMTTPSYAEFAEGPWLTRKAMSWFWDQYLPDASKRGDIYASPLSASIGQLRGLPRTLLIVDEIDVLRDEGEAYGRKLAQAGVPVTSLRYNGAIHDFMMLNALASTPPARAAVAQACGYLRNVFAAR